MRFGAKFGGVVVVGALLVSGAPASGTPTGSHVPGQVSASATHLAVPAAKKKPVATVTATYTTLSSGKVKVSIVSNAKKVQVAYRTAKNKKRTLTRTVKKGKAKVTLARGSKTIKVRGKATSKLRRSAWVPAVPAPVSTPVAGGALGALTRVDVGPDGVSALACHEVVLVGVVWVPSVIPVAPQCPGGSYRYPYGPAMWSPDGGRVAFCENYETSACRQIFVKDLVTGAATRVSAPADGDPIRGWAGEPPSWSPDGTRIAFIGGLGEPEDTNGYPDLYVKTLATGAVTNVSRDSAGAQLNGISGGPAAWSPDGTKVAFRFNNGYAAVVVKDLVTGTFTEASTAGVGSQCQDQSWSADGARLTFTCSGTSTQGQSTYWQWDAASGATTQVPAPASTWQPWEYSVDLSPDGTRIVFASRQPNLVAGDTNTDWDIFVRTLSTGTVVRVSTRADGSALAGESVDPSWSPDGRQVLFTNLADVWGYYIKTLS